MPGVTVSVESPNLQGIRTAVTSENGDYIFTLLPSGPVHDHVRAERLRARAARRHPRADTDAARRRDDGAGGRVGNGRGRRTGGGRAHPDRSGGDELHPGADRRRCRPTATSTPRCCSRRRSTPTGPGGNYSIAGSMSFENLFMVNGVTVNENLRGPGVQSLHRGRDPGDDDRDRRHLGRVRPLRRRRRQRDHQVGRQPRSADRSATR